MPSVLNLPALAVKQSPKSTIYTFAVDGKLLPEFTTVARIRRDAKAKLAGYQRPEVTRHVQAIRRYMESVDALVPNAVVLAFDSRVTFKATGKPTGSAVVGTLSIPLDDAWEDHEKPGWVVDGQQRLAAIREANIDAFPMVATCFISDNTTMQREQFILVNSTKPLPRGLVYELLPGTAAELPPNLEPKRLPVTLSERLNYDEKSPLYHLIATPTNPHGVIKDNSFIRMLENSVSDGVLYDLRAAGASLEELLHPLKTFWAAVGDVFESAWNLPPRKSRLTHGAGVIGLGFVMDAMAARHGPSGLTTTVCADELRQLEPACAWVQGRWEFLSGSRAWNDLQNTPRDIQMLTDHLLFEYRRRVVGDLVAVGASAR